MFNSMVATLWLPFNLFFIMAILGQLIGLAVNAILQNAGDDKNQNGLISQIVNKVTKSVSKKKLDASKEVDNLANSNSKKLF